MSPQLTAVIFSYNRRDIVETALRGARFADRLVVIDKGSTDGTAGIARRYADEFYSARWSPTVEPTRAEYMPQIAGDWLLMLDDDECLNVEAIAYARRAILSDEHDVHFLPLRHYILGRHDERAYYWPEHHGRLFRRGAVDFAATVHGGMNFLSDRRTYVPADDGAAIIHLSHPNSRAWLEKTNRYTDQRDRNVLSGENALTGETVRLLMDRWLREITDQDDPYLTAVAALRGIYDVVDLIKAWEQRELPNGEEAFLGICKKLNDDYDGLGIPRHSRNGGRIAAVAERWRRLLDRRRTGSPGQSSSS
jgi:glycosyltransferase involved in cell wall biosynthesis